LGSRRELPEQLRHCAKDQMDRHVCSLGKITALQCQSFGWLPGGDLWTWL